MARVVHSRALRGAAPPGRGSELAWLALQAACGVGMGPVQISFELLPARIPPFETGAVSLPVLAGLKRKTEARDSGPAWPPATGLPSPLRCSSGLSSSKL